MRAGGLSHLQLLVGSGRSWRKLVRVPARRNAGSGPANFPSPGGTDERHVRLERAPSRITSRGVRRAGGARLAVTRRVPSLPRRVKSSLPRSASDTCASGWRTPDGTGQRPLTVEGETNLEPSWTPDGSGIVFTSWLDGNPDIFLMDADGSNWRPVTRDTGVRPQRAPVPGREARGLRLRANGDPDVWVIGRDGSNPVNLTRSPSSFDVDPDWSPDGTRIVFASDRDGGRRFSLWTMRGRWDGARAASRRGRGAFALLVAGRIADRHSPPTGISTTPRST